LVAFDDLTTTSWLIHKFAVAALFRAGFRCFLFPICLPRALLVLEILTVWS
jgi:hypothetical protein